MINFENFLSFFCSYRSINFDNVSLVCLQQIVQQYETFSLSYWLVVFVFLSISFVHYSALSFWHSPVVKVQLSSFTYPLFIGLTRSNYSLLFNILCTTETKLFAFSRSFITMINWMVIDSVVNRNMFNSVFMADMVSKPLYPRTPLILRILSHILYMWRISFPFNSYVFEPCKRVSTSIIL